VPDPEVQQLRAELEELRTAADYNALKPIVEAFQAVLNASSSNAYYENVAREGLRVIKGLQQKFGAAQPSRTAIEHTAMGLLNLGSVEADKMYNVAGNATFNIVANSIKQMPEEPIVEVAFVLLAMTQTQADELASHQVFEQQPDILQQNFASLADYLAKNGQPKWPSDYGLSPEEWRPRGGSSIAELVGLALSSLNATGEFKKLNPVFHNIEEFSGLTLPARNLLRQLRTNGCVMIVDAISLRHPKLLQAYQRSLLDAFPNTSVLTVTPDANALSLMQGMVHALQLNLHESEFQLRCDDILEDSCQVDFQLNRVPRWLVREVRRIYATAAARPSTFGR